MCHGMRAAISMRVWVFMHLCCQVELCRDDCRNYSDTTGSLRIKCNFFFFASLSENAYHVYAQEHMKCFILLKTVIKTGEKKCLISTDDCTLITFN